MKKQQISFLVAIVLTPLMLLGCQGKQVSQSNDSESNGENQTAAKPQSNDDSPAAQENSDDSTLAKFKRSDSAEKNQKLASELLKLSKQEFDATVKALEAKVAAASDETEQTRIFVEGNPVPGFLDRMRHLVKTYPKAPAAFEGAMQAMGYAKGIGKDEWLSFLFDNWSEKLNYPAILEESLREIPSSIVEQRLRRSIQSAPKGEMHAKMLMGFKTYLNNLPEFRDTIAVNPQISSRLPKEQLEYLNAERTDEENDEVASYLQTVIDEYGDMDYFASSGMLKTETFGEAAEMELYELRNLQVGMIAPEIIGQDLDGVKFKLSDYRGKVVMLDFWGNWCPPCRRLYPREREMVKQMAGLPFALIGVNSDPDMEKSKATVIKSKLPWRNFWNGPKGPDGPIARQWNVSAWPTIYLIDGDGIIRYKEVRGAALDRGIEKLMAELGTDVSLTTGENFAIKKP